VDVPQPQSMQRVMIVTENPELLDDLLRITAATGVDAHVVSHSEGIRVSWARTSIVVVDAAMAAMVNATALPRRPGVLVVTNEPTPQSHMPEKIWTDALALGAEHVVSLPDGERWLLQRFREVHEGPSRDGQVITVMGACGGAGTSTLAAGLARVAHHDGQQVLLVDLNGLSGGIDLILGADEAIGGRWVDVHKSSGRMSAHMLRDALPTIEGITVLAPSRHEFSEMSVESVSHVIDAGIRGFDVVILDLPCAVSAVNEYALSRANESILLTPAHVLPTCSALVVSKYIQEHATSLRLVVREVRDGLDPAVVAAAVNQPLTHTIAHRPRIVEAANTAEPPDIDDSFAQSCRRLLPTNLTGVAA
jgi:secretion/DNA translocation related CpaE-like protein